MQSASLRATSRQLPHLLLENEARGSGGKGKRHIASTPDRTLGSRSAGHRDHRGHEARGLRRRKWQTARSKHSRHKTGKSKCRPLRPLRTRFQSRRPTLASAPFSRGAFRCWRSGTLRGGARALRLFGCWRLGDFARVLWGRFAHWRCVLELFRVLYAGA